MTVNVSARPTPVVHILDICMKCINGEFEHAIAVAVLNIGPCELSMNLKMQSTSVIRVLNICVSTVQSEEEKERYTKRAEQQQDLHHRDRSLEPQ